MSLRFAVVALLLASLAACTVLPEAESFRRFSLPQDEAVSAADEQASFPLTLRVHSPQAGRVLGGSRIVVEPEANEISSYRGARWSESAPKLLRDRIIGAFQQSGRVGTVIDEQNRLSTDLELVSKLNAFQSEYVNGIPRVRIQLDVQLTRAGGRELIASRRFEVTEASPDESIESVVESFGRAGDRLSAAVVEWTMDQLPNLKNAGRGASAGVFGHPRNVVDATVLGSDQS